MFKGFQKPKRLVANTDTLGDRYGMFWAQPFERGFGTTIGTGLRRVLLSSIEGAAITAVRIEGVAHEFSPIPGVAEDATDIILNLKKVLFKAHAREPQLLRLSVNKEGPVLAGDIELNQNVELTNPKQIICTLDRKRKFEMELEVKVGRGFCPGEENKKPDQPIGVIAIDSLFSPVTRVKYAVESARVGQRTDYDRLILEIWTDGRISPEQFSKDIGREVSPEAGPLAGRFASAIYFSPGSAGLADTLNGCSGWGPGAG